MWVYAMLYSLTVTEIPYILGLVHIWMYELGLGIAHLEFRGPNSAVWVAMEFEFGNWPKFRAKSTMCYSGLAYFRAALLRIS
jgi:hypothetical protein